MALIPVQNSQLTSLQENPRELQASCDSITTIAAAEASEETEMQKMVLVFQGYKTQMQGQMDLYVEENRQLRIRLPTRMGRQRALENGHQHKLEELRTRVEVSRKEVELMRQKVVESALKENEPIATAIAARKLAVEAETQAGDVQVAKAREEVKVYCKTHYEREIQKINAHNQSERQRVSAIYEQRIQASTASSQSSFQAVEHQEELAYQSQIQKCIEFHKLKIINHNSEFIRHKTQILSFSVGEGKAWEVPSLSVPEFVPNYQRGGKICR